MERVLNTFFDLLCGLDHRLKVCRCNVDIRIASGLFPYICFECAPCSLQKGMIAFSRKTKRCQSTRAEPTGDIRVEFLVI